jgi:hypothetical protein
VGVSSAVVVSVEVSVEVSEVSVVVPESVDVSVLEVSVLVSLDVSVLVSLEVSVLVSLEVSGVTGSVGVVSSPSSRLLLVDSTGTSMFSTRDDAAEAVPALHVNPLSS